MYMYCNDFFLDICHRDHSILNQTVHAHTVDLLMTVSALALALHILMFVPRLFPFLFVFIFVFFCLFGRPV